MVEMKTYEITRSTSGQIGVLIKTDTPNRNAKLLQHCILHSPTGMETGCGGSGPADLAASILADHFGVTPERVRNIYAKSWTLEESFSLAHKVIKLHQLFKAHFIAPRQLDPGQSYEILGAEIASWLGDQEK